jgi:hypothetical protein
MPTLTVRSVMPGTMNGSTGHPSLVGHAWIEIQNGSSVESFGFYPETSNPYQPGEVKGTDADDYRGEGDFSEGFYITEAQAQAIRDFAVISNQFSTYAIFGGGTLNPFGTYNCATWVPAAIRAAGISGIQIPLLTFAPWSITGQFNPNTTWEAEGWNIDPTGVNSGFHSGSRTRAPAPPPPATPSPSTSTATASAPAPAGCAPTTPGSHWTATATA